MYLVAAFTVLSTLSPLRGGSEDNGDGAPRARRRVKRQDACCHVMEHDAPVTYLGEIATDLRNKAVQQGEEDHRLVESHGQFI